MGKSPRVAVVGGGLSGLTAAWRLQASGCEVKVFERSQAVGGRTCTIRQDGFVFDVGAITMLPTYAQTCALVQELGLARHLHRIVPIIGIPREGRTHRLDLARPLKSLMSTPLISFGTKLRMFTLLQPLIRTWKLSTYETLSTLAEFDVESIAEFSRRECGEEFHEYVAGPIIRGNTLNDTECAPAAELLWMLRQYAAPYVLAFDAGMNFLAESLGERLPVQYGAEVVAVETMNNKVTVRVGGQLPGTETFDACVLAVPPPQLRELAPRSSRAQRAFLDSAEPLCSVSVHVGLSQAPAATETFILPPRSEQPHLTTIVMDHLKAPGRAPAGKGVVSLFLRDTWCKEHYDQGDEQILTAVLAMAAPFIGDIAPYVQSRVVQRWPYAIIKSRVGLYSRIAAYEADIDMTDRVQIAGDFLSMGMEAAVGSGSRAAERIERLVKRLPPKAAAKSRALKAGVEYT